MKVKNLLFGILVLFISWDLNAAQARPGPRFMLGVGYTKPSYQEGSGFSVAGQAVDFYGSFRFFMWSRLYMTFSGEYLLSTQVSEKLPATAGDLSYWNAHGVLGMYFFKRYVSLELGGGYWHYGDNLGVITFEGYSVPSFGLTLGKYFTDKAWPFARARYTMLPGETVEYKLDNDKRELILEAGMCFRLKTKMLGLIGEFRDIRFQYNSKTALANFRSYTVRIVLAL